MEDRNSLSEKDTEEEVEEGNFFPATVVDDAATVAVVHPPACHEHHCYRPRTLGEKLEYFYLQFIPLQQQHHQQQQQSNNLINNPIEKNETIHILFQDILHLLEDHILLYDEGEDESLQTEIIEDIQRKMIQFLRPFYIDSVNQLITSCTKRLRAKTALDGNHSQIDHSQRHIYILIDLYGSWSNLLISLVNYSFSKSSWHFLLSSLIQRVAEMAWQIVITFKKDRELDRWCQEFIDLESEEEEQNKNLLALDQVLQQLVMMYSVEEQYQQFLYSSFERYTIISGEEEGEGAGGGENDDPFLRFQDILCNSILLLSLEEGRGGSSNGQNSRVRSDPLQLLPLEMINRWKELSFYYTTLETAYWVWSIKQALLQGELVEIEESVYVPQCLEDLLFLFQKVIERCLSFQDEQIVFLIGQKILEVFHFLLVPQSAADSSNGGGCSNGSSSSHTESLLSMILFQPMLYQGVLQPVVMEGEGEGGEENIEVVNMERNAGCFKGRRRGFHSTLLTFLVDQAFTTCLKLPSNKKRQSSHYGNSSGGNQMVNSPSTSAKVSSTLSVKTPLTTPQKSDGLSKEIVSSSFNTPSQPTIDSNNGSNSNWQDVLATTTSVTSSWLSTWASPYVDSALAATGSMKLNSRQENDQSNDDTTTITTSGGLLDMVSNVVATGLTSLATPAKESHSDLTTASNVTTTTTSSSTKMPPPRNMTMEEMLLHALDPDAQTSSNNNNGNGSTFMSASASASHIELDNSRFIESKMETERQAYWRYYLSIDIYHNRNLLWEVKDENEMKENGVQREEEEVVYLNALAAALQASRRIYATFDPTSSSSLLESYSGSKTGSNNDANETIEEECARWWKTKYPSIAILAEEARKCVQDYDSCLRHGIHRLLCRHWFLYLQRPLLGVCRQRDWQLSGNEMESCWHQSRLAQIVSDYLLSFQPRQEIDFRLSIVLNGKGSESGSNQSQGSGGGLWGDMMGNLMSWGRLASGSTGSSTTGVDGRRRNGSGKADPSYLSEPAFHTYLLELTIFFTRTLLEDVLLLCDFNEWGALLFQQEVMQVIRYLQSLLRLAGGSAELLSQQHGLCLALTRACSFLVLDQPSHVLQYRIAPLDPKRVKEVLARRKDFRQEIITNLSFPVVNTSVDKQKS